MKVKIYTELSETEIVNISKKEFKNIKNHMAIVDYHLDMLDEKLNLNASRSRKLRELYLREINKNN